MNSSTSPLQEDGLWYFASANGRQEGPVSKSDLVIQARAGRLSADDLVWTEGMASWVSARDIAGLFSSGVQDDGHDGTRITPGGANGVSNAMPQGRPRTTKINVFLAFTGKASFYQYTGRVCGLLAVAFLLGSIALVYFGVSWFGGVLVFASLWFLGEGIAAILRALQELAPQRRGGSAVGVNHPEP